MLCFTPGRARLRWQAGNVTHRIHQTATGANTSGGNNHAGTRHSALRSLQRAAACDSDLDSQLARARFSMLAAANNNPGSLSELSSPIPSKPASFRHAHRARAEHAAVREMPGLVTAVPGLRISAFSSRALPKRGSSLAAGIGRVLRVRIRCGRAKKNGKQRSKPILYEIDQIQLE